MTERINPEDPALREAINAHLWAFLDARGPLSRRDVGAVLSAFMAEATHTMYYAVGTSVTAGVVEHMLSTIKAHPARGLFDPLPDAHTQHPPPKDVQ